MAERIGRLPEPRRPRTTARPWDEWLDGSPWQGVQGKDFRGSVDTFAAAVRAEARRRGLRARVIRVDDKTVAWQQIGELEATRAPRGTGRAWTLEDVQCLVDAWYAGETTGQIAVRMGRTGAAVAAAIARLRKIGVEIAARNGGHGPRWPNGTPGPTPTVTHAQWEALAANARNIARERRERVWTLSDLQQLIDLWYTGLLIREIADVMDRGRAVLTSRITAIRDSGIAMPNRHRTGEWRAGHPGPAPVLNAADYDRIADRMHAVRENRRT